MPKLEPGEIRLHQQLHDPGNLPLPDRLGNRWNPTAPTNPEGQRMAPAQGIDLICAPAKDTY